MEAVLFVIPVGHCLLWYCFSSALHWNCYWKCVGTSCSTVCAWSFMASSPFAAVSILVLLLGYFLFFFWLLKKHFCLYFSHYFFLFLVYCLDQLSSSYLLEQSITFICRNISLFWQCLHNCLYFVLINLFLLSIFIILNGKPDGV